MPESVQQIQIGDKYRISSESAPVRYRTLHEIYRKGQRTGFCTGDEALFTQRGYDRYDFALLIKHGEAHRMFTLFSRNGRNFENGNDSGLEVTLAAEDEVTDRIESYKF